MVFTSRQKKLINPDPVTQEEIIRTNSKYHSMSIVLTLTVFLSNVSMQEPYFEYQMVIQHHYLQ